MSRRELRGTRYLRANNQWVANFITTQLRYYDYAQTLQWYMAIRPHLDHTARALLGLNDRFFLLSTLLRRNDIKHPWLFQRCREVEANPDDRLDLWARYHYKSTIITFAGVIQEILLDPDMSVGIFSFNQETAGVFLSQIKRELTSNQYLKEVYSDALYQNPEKESPQWSDDGIIIRRKSNQKEATVEAHGLVDSQPIGRHFNLLVYDDVVVPKSVTTPEMVKKTTMMWELSDNLGSHERTRKWHVGTRYSYGDTYGIIIDRKALKERIYPATDDGTLRGKPVFLTTKRWNQVKKAQKSTINAQMLLNPLAGHDQMFKPEYFRGYEIFPSVMNVYIMCDPSKGRSAESDRTAIAVIGVDQGLNKYLIDGVRHRMRLSQRWDYLKRFYNYWSRYPGVQQCKVGYEVYGMQADTEVIEEYQQREGVYFPIQELNYPRSGPHSKAARIERLEPDMRNGRFYLPSVMYRPDITGPDATALWHVWEKRDAERRELEIKEAENDGTQPPKQYNVGQITWRMTRGLTKLQRAQEQLGAPHRIVKPLRRLAEDGEIYDLTWVFMEEARFFPVAPHDDLIDVTARIYDMDVLAPMVFDTQAVEGLSEDDLPGAHYDA